MSPYRHFNDSSIHKHRKNNTVQQNAITYQGIRRDVQKNKSSISTKTRVSHKLHECLRHRQRAISSHCMGNNGLVKFGTTEGMILFDLIPLLLEHDAVGIP